MGKWAGRTRVSTSDFFLGFIVFYFPIFFYSFSFYWNSGSATVVIEGYWSTDMRVHREYVCVVYIYSTQNREGEVGR